MWKSNATGISPGQLFASLTYSPEDIIHQMVIKTIGSSASNEIIITPNKEELNVNLSSLFVEKRHRSFGRCYSIDISTLISKNSVSSIKVE